MSSGTEKAEMEAEGGDRERWRYPALAKPESDGIYCYQVQRRISAWLSIRLAANMGANAATAIDLSLGVCAALLIVLDHWLWGALLIQAFGIFSCVDGEIARIRDRASPLGDFLDTLTDRTTELLVVGAIAFSLGQRVGAESALPASLALLGGVFLLTNSSEKFRSSYHMGYPKRRLEKIFGLFCAGSDSRLLMLSIGLTVGELTAYAPLLLGLMWTLAAATYVNFGVRVRLVKRHFGDWKFPSATPRE